MRRKANTQCREWSFTAGGRVRSNADGPVSRNTGLNGPGPPVGQTRPPDGFTLLELTVAAGLLGMVFLTTIPLLGRVRETREDAQQRFIALQEAANVMEQLALHAADETLANAADETWSVSDEAREVLPDATLDVTIAKASDDAGSVHVRVAVSWVNEAGERAAPVTLDAWFPGEQEQP